MSVIPDDVHDECKLEIERLKADRDEWKRIAHIETEGIGCAWHGKYEAAHAEVKRLEGMLASTPDPRPRGVDKPTERTCRCASMVWRGTPEHICRDFRVTDTDGDWCQHCYHDRACHEGQR